MRVHNLAIKFANQEKADLGIVSLASLLHDVDDYKIVGKENSEKFLNAKKIMKEENIDADVQQKILDIIANMGFSKYLKGIRPSTLEGKIVSDSDMCDAIGANGIVRSIAYSVSEKGSGTIFNKELFPNIEITSEEYNYSRTTHDTDNAINHFFEKLLKLKDIMMTSSGKKEAQKRHRIMVEFLQHFFEEENCDHKWFDLLEKFRGDNFESCIS